MLQVGDGLGVVAHDVHFAVGAEENKMIELDRSYKTTNKYKRTAEKSACKEKAMHCWKGGKDKKLNKQRVRIPAVELSMSLD